MILKTRRCFLRELQEDDMEDLCEMLCDEEVMYAYAHAFSREEATDWLQRQIASYKEHGVGLWAVIRKSDGKMLGQCGITKQYIREEAVWEIGYLFKKEYWHQGYAKEVAKVCRRYAFDKLKINRIYSIIRENNTASKKVAMALGMQVCDHFVKHYYGMDMPHDVFIYKVDEEKANVDYYIYMDAEFDAVRIQRKFHQQVISIGAVICDRTHHQISTFYQTVHPKHFHKLTRVVHHMTHLDNETILNSLCLGKVLSLFQEWVMEHVGNKEYQMYSFGPDDKRTILRHCALEELQTMSCFEEVVDLQKILSASITYQEQIVSPTLSLDDLKAIYAISGDVEHNALNDALDLMQIHIAYSKAQPIHQEAIVEIVNRKIAKQLEAKKKQQAHVRKVMLERFGKRNESFEITCYTEVLEALRTWDHRDANFHIHCKKKHIIIEDQVYAYEDLSIKLNLNTHDEIPNVTLSFITVDKEITKKYILSYHNATPIELILKRMGYSYGS